MTAEDQPRDYQKWRDYINVNYGTYAHRVDACCKATIINLVLSQGLFQRPFSAVEN